MKGVSVKSCCFIMAIPAALFCSQSMAWTESEDPIAKKYADQNYVFRTDAKRDQYADMSHATPHLTQAKSSGEWSWQKPGRQESVTHRPWGNYHFEPLNEQAYYAPEYEREAMRFRDYYRPSYTYRRYPGHYDVGYDRRYYQNSRRPIKLANHPARTYRASNPNYAYNTMMLDPLGMDYFADPYAYERY